MNLSAQTLASSLPVAADHRIPPHSTSRWKSGSNVVPLRQVSSETPKLALEDVSLSYKTETGVRLLALDKINLKVRQGEFLCLVGTFGLRQVDTAPSDCWTPPADVRQRVGR